MQKSRIFWAMALLLGLITNNFAQESVLPQFQLGVRAGANYASFHDLKNADILAQKENTFIMVGGFAQVRVLKKFGLRAEILSNPKGALVNYYDGNNVKVEAIRKLEYADVTLTAIYNFKVLWVIPCYAFAGYSYESLISARDAINSPYISNQNITQKFGANAESILGGVGLRIRLGRVNISPELRYLYGLTDISSDNVVTRNSVITASVGLGFRM